LLPVTPETSFKAREKKRENGALKKNKRWPTTQEKGGRERNDVTWGGFGGPDPLASYSRSNRASSQVFVKGGKKRRPPGEHLDNRCIRMRRMTAT